MALAIVASPLALTSCDDDPWGDNNYYYNDLVSDAVRNYLREYPSGSSYYTAYKLVLLFITQRQRPQSSMPSWMLWVVTITINWNNNYRQQENKQVNGLIF